jgi:hypothetical protein
MLAAALLGRSAWRERRFVSVARTHDLTPDARVRIPKLSVEPCCTALPDRR